MDPRDEDPTTQLLARVPTEPITSVGFTLVITEGLDAGATFRIEDLAHRRVLIGKSPACEVLLTDRGVSRRHAALELEGPAIRIFDLDSSNGVWVGTTRIRDAY